MRRVQRGAGTLGTNCCALGGVIRTGIAVWGVCVVM